MTESTPDLFVDLVSDRFGGKVLAANDEFFAPKESLVVEAAPVWDPGKFTSHGKWMDGWETRRRREPGHDWAIIRLGIPGIIRRVVIDTAHFTGNFPESAAVEAIDLPGSPDIVEMVRDPSRWRDLVPRRVLQGNTRNEIDLADTGTTTHVRLVIHPDGGVARLRTFGDPVPPEGLLDGTSEVDLAAIHNGARAIDCSDRHYSSPNRMLVPGRPKGMWDGWETRRRRGPGNDWAVIRLAGRGIVSRLDIDTTHFKGNAPGSWDVEGIDAKDATLGELRVAAWTSILASARVTANHRHHYGDLVAGPFTHLRLNIHPDGGVARFRAWGRSGEPWI